MNDPKKIHVIGMTTKDLQYLTALLGLSSPRLDGWLDMTTEECQRIYETLKATSAHLPHTLEQFRLGAPKEQLPDTPTTPGIIIDDPDDPFAPDNFTVKFTRDELSYLTALLGSCGRSEDKHGFDGENSYDLYDRLTDLLGVEPFDLPSFDISVPGDTEDDEDTNSTNSTNNTDSTPQPKLSQKEWRYVLTLLKATEPSAAKAAGLSMKEDVALFFRIKNAFLVNGDTLPGLTPITGLDDN